MLVLSRQRDESIIIGDNVVVTIVDIRGDKVRLGIEAPTEVPVHRQEVYEAIQRQNRDASQLTPRDIRAAGIQQSKRRRSDLFERHGSVKAQSGHAQINDRGDCRSTNVIPGYPILIVPCQGQRIPGRRALPGKDLHLALLRIINHQRYFAADAEGADVLDAERKQCRDRGIGCITACP